MRDILSTATQAPTVSTDTHSVSAYFAFAAKSLYLPCTVASSAFHWLVETIDWVAQKILGYLLRAVVFTFGEYKTSWLKRQIIELYKGGCFDTLAGRSAFDAERLEASRRVFEALGCKIEKIKTVDQELDPDSGRTSKIEYCVIKYAEVKKTIEQKGGKWIELEVSRRSDGIFAEDFLSDESIEVILQDENADNPDWATYYKDTLSKMVRKSPLQLGWEEIEVEIDGKKRKALLTMHWKPGMERPKEGLCIVRSHAPTSSWAMERGYAAVHLGLHMDSYFYDPRGYYKSVGRISEGGGYLDAETIYQLARSHGYAPSDIYSTGFCLGGAYAINLFARHQFEGMNLVTENTFDTLPRVFEASYGFVGYNLAMCGIRELKSHSPEVKHLTPQDYFNSEAKLAALRPNTGAGGHAIIINTTPDHLIAQDAPQRLFVAAQKGTEKATQLIYAPKGQVEGHSLDPFADPKLFERYVTQIARQSPRSSRAVP